MRNGSSTSSGPTTTSTHSVAYRSVHSSQGVRTVNTTASRRSWKTLFAEWSAALRIVGVGVLPRLLRGLGPQEQQDHERRAVRDRDHDRRVRRDQCGQQHAGRGRARRLLQCGADRPLEPVRGEELPRREEARQDRAVRREEEPGPGARG